MTFRELTRIIYKEMGYTDEQIEASMRRKELNMPGVGDNIIEDHEIEHFKSFGIRSMNNPEYKAAIHKLAKAEAEEATKNN